MVTFLAILTLVTAVADLFATTHIKVNGQYRFKYGPPLSVPAAIAAGYLALCLLGAVAPAGFTPAVAWITLAWFAAVGVWSFVAGLSILAELPGFAIAWYALSAVLYGVPILACLQVLGKL